MAPRAFAVVSQGGIFRQCSPGFVFCLARLYCAFPSWSSASVQRPCCARPMKNSPADRHGVPTPGTMLAQQNEPFAQQSDPRGRSGAAARSSRTTLRWQRTTPHDSCPANPLAAAASEATAAVTEATTDNPADAPKLTEPGAPEQPSPAAASETARDALTAPEPDNDGARGARNGTRRWLGSGRATPLTNSAVAERTPRPGSRLSMRLRRRPSNLRRRRPSRSTCQQLRPEADRSRDPRSPRLAISRGHRRQARKKTANNETRARPIATSSRIACARNASPRRAATWLIVHGSCGAPRFSNSLPAAFTTPPGHDQSYRPRPMSRPRRIRTAFRS